jgi:hypothetical protein
MSDMWTFGDIPEKFFSNPAEAGTLPEQAGISSIGSDKPDRTPPANGKQSAVTPDLSKADQASPDQPPPEDKKKLMEEFGSIIKGRTEETQKLLERQKRLLEEQRTPALRQGRVGAPPPNDLGQNAMLWLGAAGALAGFAGAFSRRGSINALTAFGAALDGFKEGDEERFKANFKEWDAQRQRVNDNNQAEFREYEATLKKQDLDRRQMANEIEITAAKWQNQFIGQIASHAAETGNFDLLAVALDGTQGEIAKYYESSNRLSMQARKYQDQIDNSHEIAKGIAEGSIPPSMAKGAAASNRIIQADLHKMGVDIQQLALQELRAQQQVRALNSQRMLQFSTYAGRSLQTVARLKELAAEMDQFGITRSIPLINSAEMTYWLQAHRDSRQGEVVAEYQLEVNALQEELGQMGAAGYAPTESIWQRVKGMINGNFGAHMLNAQLDELQRYINFTVGAVPGMEKYGPMGQPNPYMPGVGPAANQGIPGLPPGVTVEPWGP